MPTFLPYKNPILPAEALCGGSGCSMYRLTAQRSWAGTLPYANRWLAALCAAPARGILSAAIMQRLDSVKAEFAAVEGELMSGSVEPAALARVSRHHAALSRKVAAIHEYEGALAEWQDLRDLMDAGSAPDASSEDSALADMAAGEEPAAAEALAAAEHAVRVAMLPSDEADMRDAIVEVRAGSGGAEAALFAGEVFRMYEGYAKRAGWTWSVLSTSPTDEGGLKEGIAEVSGDGAFGQLRWEVGGHRVQRVPATESTGRVHTSAMTVAVLPKAEEVDVQLRPADLRVETYRASGAGGQHVNTTDSAVRVTHLPTGTVVQCQDERSQHQNKARALSLLRARVYAAQQEAVASERAALRKDMVGSGDRSQRIRTYNFAQDRITDHRVALSKHGMTAMLQGELLEDFWAALRSAEETAALEALERE